MLSIYIYYVENLTMNEKVCRKTKQRIQRVVKKNEEAFPDLNLKQTRKLIKLSKHTSLCCDNRTLPNARCRADTSLNRDA